MSHLKFYLNGTPGLKDGTEIDLTALMDIKILSGLAGAGGTGGCKAIRFYLREDEGYRATGLLLQTSALSGELTNCICPALAGPYTTKTAMDEERELVPYGENGISLSEVSTTNIGFLLIVAGDLGLTVNNYDILSVSFVEDVA